MCAPGACSSTVRRAGRATDPSAASSPGSPRTVTKPLISAACVTRKGGSRDERWSPEAMHSQGRRACMCSTQVNGACTHVPEMSMFLQAPKMPPPPNWMLQAGGPQACAAGRQAVAAAPVTCPAPPHICLPAACSSSAASPPSCNPHALVTLDKGVVELVFCPVVFDARLQQLLAQPRQLRGACSREEGRVLESSCFDAVVIRATNRGSRRYAMPAHGVTQSGSMRTLGRRPPEASAAARSAAMRTLCSRPSSSTSIRLISSRYTRLVSCAVRGRAARTAAREVEGTPLARGKDVAAGAHTHRQSCGGGCTHTRGPRSRHICRRCTQHCLVLWRQRARPPPAHPSPAHLQSNKLRLPDLSIGGARPWPRDLCLCCLHLSAKCCQGVHKPLALGTKLLYGQGAAVGVGARLHADVEGWKVGAVE